jgi:hypothetical protein
LKHEPLNLGLAEPQSKTGHTGDGNTSSDQAQDQVAVAAHPAAGGRCWLLLHVCGSDLDGTTFPEPQGTIAVRT